MPSCFVAACTVSSSTKEEKSIILHCFPKKKENLTIWLRCCGVDDEEMESRIAQVLADKKNDKFRICSHHFSAVQYESTSSVAHGGRRRLITGAVPDQNLAARAAFLPVPLVSTQTIFVNSDSQTICSFQSMKNIACQTDFTCVNAECQTDVDIMLHEDEKKDAFAQWPEYEENYMGDIIKVSKDHGYSKAKKQSPPINLVPIHESTPVKGPLFNLMEAMECEPIEYEEFKDSFDASNLEPSLGSMVDDKKKDPDCSEPSRAESDSFCEVVQDELEDMVGEKKYLVFRSCLLSLLSMVCCSFLIEDETCQEGSNSGPVYKKCDKPMVNFETEESGSCFLVKACCFDNHQGISWSSQPMIGRVSAGNLLIASSILFSGLTYEKAARFAGFLGLEFIGSSTFFKYQKKYLFPTINEAWLHEQMELDILFSGVEMKLSGDGQCDSPGFSAKYLVYTVMDQKTGKILCVIVVQVTDCTSSVAMEKHALVIALEALKKRGLKIDVLTTDRHVSIAKVMRENYMEINHQFDVWHVAKSIKKKLLEASKKKGCAELNGWSQSITNHLWWSSRTCEKSVTLMKEKWMSLLHHTTNKHHWNGFNQFHECEHEQISNELKRKKKWLKAERPAHDALVKIVSNKTLQKDLRGLTEFTHTGAVEVFHSMVLKYRPKQEHFSIDGMEARSRLAALAHNANTGRSQARKRAGGSDDEMEDEGMLRYKVEFTKGRKAWVAKKIFEGMQYAHVYDMMVHVLEMKKSDLLTDWQSRSDEIPKNIAQMEAPDKEELVKKMTTRF